MKRIIIPELFDKPFAKHIGNGKELEVPASTEMLPEQDRKDIDSVYRVYNIVNSESNSAVEILVNLLAHPRSKGREIIIAGRIMRKISDLPLKDNAIGSNLDLEDAELEFLKDKIFFPTETKGKRTDGQEYEKDEFFGFTLNAMNAPLLEAIDDAKEPDKLKTNKSN